MYNHQEQSVSEEKIFQSASKAGIHRENKNPEFQHELQLKEKAQQRNDTGLPDHLKSGIENLSGHSMDDVKVHYNSAKPAQLNAHAYAQGNQIHLGSGQERHLAHEAWHVVQQKQGRVQPTVNVNGARVNDDVGLEKEADVMGGKALQFKSKEYSLGSEGLKFVNIQPNVSSMKSCIQRAFNATALENFDAAKQIITTAEDNYETMDAELDGNRANWGFTNDTWNTLRDNITIKSNHIRGQGVADALESLSWSVSDNPRSVRGPGGGAGIDLRLFTSGGVGGARMDIEVKHANTIASLRAQIDSAVAAHGNNQTIKMYTNPSIHIPEIGDTFVRAGRTYTFRGLGYDGDEASASVEFYEDTDAMNLVRRRIISWV